jgi:membrane-bound ClpP family serine protease
MTAGGKISSAASKDNEFGYSAKAVEEIREREKKIAEAKTREERELAKASAKLYRINLIFAGDEADLVRQVLGDNPSERILEFCKTVS